jgi:4-amino-4-deoxy-L-arabinose transferase-like glycosyltransferase
LTEDDERQRRGGYLLFHVGLLIAFFAKGFAGWMVPVSALATVIVLERRWRELASRELWWGAWVPCVLVLGWVAWLWMRPDGRAQLLVLFWYNLVGRVVAIDAPAAFGYSAGHLNSPGKYLLELPLYLLPWTPLALAALRKLPRALRRTDQEGTAWRLGLGAVVLPTLLLSVAATARGVYYAPVALGFAVLIGLYVAGSGAASDRFDRWAWRTSGVLIALVALVLGAVTLLACLAPLQASTASVLLALVALVGTLTAIGLALTPRQMNVASLPRQAVAWTLVLTLVLGPLYVRLNDWLSLETLALRIQEASHGAPLDLVDPDETTLAMASLYLPAAHLAARPTGASSPAGAAESALWLMPGGRWNGRQWMSFLGYLPPDTRPPVVPTVPAGFEKSRIRCVIERPGGRAFALLDAGAVSGSALEPCDVPATGVAQ